MRIFRASWFLRQAVVENFGEHISLDEALAAMKSAGYEQIGLLTPTRDDPFIGPAATTEYLANLQEKINAHGLRAIMGALASRHDIPLADSMRDVQRQIDNAEQMFVGLKRLNKEAKMVVFPGENHFLSWNGRPEHRIERLEHYVRWFSDHLHPSR